jgi:inosine/xanthosine triphosphate pyrophosphatase family protein
MTLPRLMTSNPDKLAEFRRLGLPATMGGTSADLQEADAAPYFVCAHKAHLSGAGALCEDTRLDVEGSDIGIHVKFSLERLADLAGRRARFACCLALCSEDSVSVWEGSVEGLIDHARGLGGFGFDPYFYPSEAMGESLAQLDSRGLKDNFSARALACAALSTGQPVAVFARADLEAYKGPWQQAAAAKPLKI